MSKKIKIAFDLDGIIIDKPPLIPKNLLERLFRGCNYRSGLHYRFPKSKLEISIRKISHFYLFRPPIKENIDFIKKIAKSPKYEIYIISGRYSFLLSETKNWFSKRKLNELFKKVYFNLNDEQPHLHKEKLLLKIKPDYFIDDDEELVDYLREKLDKTKLFYYQKGKTCSLGDILNFD